MRRRLTLRKETLAELTPADLGDVVGAQATPACPRPPTEWCPTIRPIYCYVSELVDPCVTLNPSCIC